MASEEEINYQDEEEEYYEEGEGDEDLYDEEGEGGEEEIATGSEGAAASSGGDKTPSKSDKPEGPAPYNHETSIHVANVDYSVEVVDLANLFGTCGTLKRIKIPTGPDGRAKGFAIIEFVDEECVEKAMALSDTSLKDRNIKVTKLQPQEPFGGRFGGRGGRGRGGRGFRGGGRFAGRGGRGFRGGGRFAGAYGGRASPGFRGGRASPGFRGGGRGYGGRGW